MGSWRDASPSRLRNGYARTHYRMAERRRWRRRDWPKQQLAGAEDGRFNTGDRVSTDSLVDEKQGGQMLSRVRGLRRQLGDGVGVSLCAVHITDNLRLKPREYVVSLRGNRDRALADRAELRAGGEQRSQGAADCGNRDSGAGVWRCGALDCAGLEEQALAAGYSVVTRRP